MTQERTMATRSETKKKPEGINLAVVMLILVIGGLACVAGLQRLLAMRLASQAAQQAQWVEEKGPAWHLQLDDSSEQKIFIGFRYGDRVYIDASELCLQPGFRAHADEDGLVQVKDREGVPLVVEAPDILLPENLAQESWTVVSAHQPPESRVFDTPYQWLSKAHAPANGACLFLGQGPSTKVPRKIYTSYAEPVIGLMGGEEMPDIRLQANEEAIEVTSKNRLESLRKIPWLLAWLHQFSSAGAKECASPDGFMPSSILLPMKVKMLPNGQQAMHWLVATGCEQLDRWSLVMANEDGTTSFLTRNETMSYSEFEPEKVWTADIDSDGIPELLIKARYPRGTKYVLLRLNENEGGGYYLSEIATSAYEGR
jgi:hypothetical protein